jgi:hypothetical protein
MQIYAVPPPKRESKILIGQWAVHEIACEGSPVKTHHLVGRMVYEECGRVSSAIQSFDRGLMQLTTRSGRIYLLDGRPGRTDSAEDVWSEWKALNNVIGDIDVSDQYV